MRRINHLNNLSSNILFIIEKKENKMIIVVFNVCSFWMRADVCPTHRSALIKSKIENNRRVPLCLQRFSATKNNNMSNRNVFFAASNDLSKSKRKNYFVANCILSCTRKKKNRVLYQFPNVFLFATFQKCCTKKQQSKTSKMFLELVFLIHL